jgi:hypothetical protein
MMRLENPPGFVVSTEARKAASDKGFRLERGTHGGWLRYASTTAPGTVWIAALSSRGLRLLSIDHGGVAAELGPATAPAAASIAAVAALKPGDLVVVTKPRRPRRRCVLRRGARLRWSSSV